MVTRGASIYRYLSNASSCNVLICGWTCVSFWVLFYRKPIKHWFYLKLLYICMCIWEIPVYSSDYSGGYLIYRALLIQYPHEVSGNPRKGYGKGNFLSSATATILSYFNKIWFWCSFRWHKHADFFLQFFRSRARPWKIMVIGSGQPRDPYADVATLALSNARNV